MSVLPLNWPDKVDSPELLAWLQQFGSEKYIDSNQINSIRDALNELHARTADTRIVENTGLDIVGTDVIINELWKWLILSVSYTNNSTITLPITLSSAGNQKICFLCANQSNGFELVYGPESETNPVAPTIDSNLLYITFFIVTDSEVGSPVGPIVGDIYKKKSEELGYGDPNLTGANAVIKLRPEGNSRYAFSNAGLTSILGFSLELITGNPNAEVPYPSKNLFIENTGATPFSLIHDGAGTADRKFFFLDETDLVVPPGGKVWLKYDSTAVELFWKSWGINFPSDGKTYGVKNGIPIQINSNQYFKYSVRATGVGLTYIGENAVSVAGSASNTFETNYGASFYQVATLGTAGNVGEVRQSSFGRKTKAQIGDFSMMMYFNANGSANFRCFGGSSQVYGIGNINPSTYVSYLFGIGADDTDSNYQLMYGDSSGSRTKINLGWSKRGKKYFFLHLENNISNGNTDVIILNLKDNLVYTTSVPFTFWSSYRLWCGNSIDNIIVSAGFNFIDLNVKF